MSKLLPVIKPATTTAGIFTRTVYVAYFHTVFNLTD